MKRLVFILASAALLFSCASEPKVNYKVWLDWPERNLPTDYESLGEPSFSGVKINLDLTDIPDSLNHYCALFETTLDVRKEEVYEFILTTDDGSKLYIDGECLIENDGAHGPIEKKVSKPLGKGKHDIRIEYFEYDKGQSLVFRYSTPTIKQRELNDKVLERQFKQASNKKFVKPQVKEAYTRFAQWKGNDEVLAFPILTDIHTANRFSYLHIGYAAQAAKKFKADFMANLGDIGLNSYPATLDKEYARSIRDNTLAQMKKYDGIWLYSPGNHDWDAGEGDYFTEEEVSDFFQKPWEKKAGGNMHLVPGKTYYWYDIPEKNFRIILLNSCGTRTLEGHYYYFDDPQLEWFQALLEQTPKDMNVIVLSHYMPHRQGRWTTSPAADYTLIQNEKLMTILSGFKESGGTLVGMFTGDSHTNDHMLFNGVNYYISQGYGWVTPEAVMPGSKHAFFEYTESLCIDVVAVKPATREVKTFRIGAGGPEYDFTFPY